MRHRLKVIVAALCTLALAVTPVFAAWGDTSSGEMSASDQTTVAVPGVKRAANGANGQTVTAHRINTFKLDGEYFYQSLGDDGNKPTLTLSTSKLQDIVKTKLLPNWSKVAASVFRDQADQLVDLCGEQPIGGNMSQAGFDLYFNMNKAGGKYKDEEWSTSDISSKLRQTSGSHAGERGYDQLTVTGLKRVSSLNEARDLVGQALVDCQNNDGLSASDFLGVTERDENERLDALKSTDSTTGFANIVTAINCKGSSADFDYVSFGIVLYDFEPVPVAARGLEYQMGKVLEDRNEKGSNSSVISNSQQQDAAHSAALGDSVTETDSTTLSALASAKMSENIGASIGVSQTESSSDTDFWADDESFGASTTTSSESISMGANWGAAWEMAGALGAEQGHSTSKQVSKAVETTILLPPHTATSLGQTTETTTYTQYYQQPVILNYKVAIFAVSGDYYCSSAFGGMGAINPSRYDKQSLVIKFDTKSESRPSYGCAATDDLYSRVVVNRTVGDYDVAGGRTYSTHSTAGGFTESKDINWDNVARTAQNYYGVTIAGDVARTNYFYETMGKLKVEKDKTSSNVTPLYPLYDLDHVTAPTKKFVLYSNNALDRKALALEGYNRYNVPFYGFASNISQWGEWRLCREDGTLINEGDNDYQEKMTDFNRLVATEGDTLVANPGTDGGSFYLTWRFYEPQGQEGTNNEGQGQEGANKPEPARTKTGEHDPQNLYALNNATGAKKLPVVEIEVVNTALDKPTVTAKGSYTGFWGKKINLNNVITNVVVTDDTNKKIDTHIMWECYNLPSEGITVTEGGDVEFSKPGAYLVRPFVVTNKDPVTQKRSKAYSDWIPIVATEHNLVHYNAKDPTNCTGGDAYGWKEHYRCSDTSCDHTSVKYFSDAEGKNELTEDEVIINPPGHNWGDWTTTKNPEGNKPGEQQRVCKNRSSHVEKRNLYLVQFNMKGNGTAPKSQTIVSGGSVTVPTEPKAAGKRFEGWYADEACTKPYDFGATVTSNLTLYANWSDVMYTVATVAVVDETVADSEDGSTGQKITPANGCSIHIGAMAVGGTYNESTEEDGDGYKYYYTEVAAGQPVTLTVVPSVNYQLKTNGIQAVQVLSGLTEGSSFTPTGPTTQDGKVTYSFDMPASDVAVVGSFVPSQVTVTYNGNPPEKGTVALATETETFNRGNKPPNANQTPTFTPTTAGTTYTFGGWFTDRSCTIPFLSTSRITVDTTLYAKWTPDATPITTSTVHYKLMYRSAMNYDPDEASYAVEKGSTAYDPTGDLYALAGQDTLANYELKKGDNSRWFIGTQSTTPNDDFFATAKSFDFNTPITEDTYLYAQVVTREAYAVTYNSDGVNLGTQNVECNKPIGTIDSKSVTIPTKEGYTLSGWTVNGAAWDIANKNVTNDMSLYAQWAINKYTVTFDANGHGTAPTAQNVTHGQKAQRPEYPTAAGYTFGGWCTDAACTVAYNFDAPVTSNIKLYAKWTANPAPTTITPAAVATTITPAAVAITNASSPLRNNVVVSWGAVNDADGYEVAVGSIITSVNANQTTVNVANTMLKQGKKYSVMVRAWHMNGNVKTYGNWSAEKKVKISKRYMAKTKKKVKAYKKASTGSAVKAKLKKKTTVKVLKVKGKWAKTNKGWIQKKYLKAVKTVNTPTDLASTVLTAAADLTAQSTPSDSASSLTAGQIG